MIQLSHAWALTLGELLLLSCLALLMIGGLAYWRHRQNLAASRALVEEIKHTEPQRREATAELLKEHYGYPEASLDQMVQDIHRAERTFYQFILTMYLRRDPKHLRQLRERLEEFTHWYRHLATQRLPPASAARSSADTGELDRLLRENQKLSLELQSTMDVMSRIINDYASLFTPPSEDMNTPHAPGSLPTSDSAGVDLDEAGFEGLDQTASLSALMEAPAPQVKSATPDDSPVDLGDDISDLMGDLDHLFSGNETVSEAGLMADTKDLDTSALSESLFPAPEDGGMVLKGAGDSPLPASDATGEIILDNIDLLGDLEALSLSNESEPDFDSGATVVTKR